MDVLPLLDLIIHLVRIFYCLVFSFSRSTDYCFGLDFGLAKTTLRGGGGGIEDRFKVNNYKISLSTKRYYIFGQHTAQITAKHAESLVDGEINFFLCEN